MSKTRIRGITIELNGDASGLSKELKTVNSDLKTTQSALRDVDKLLKLDPGNTELLSQKQKLLNQALTETKQKLDIEKKALAELAKTDSTGAHQAEQDALQREIVETEEKVKSLQKEIKNFGSVGVQQVKAFGEKLQEIGGKISSVGQEMTMKLTVPIVAAFGVAANAASDYEENLNKIDVAFGDSAETVKDWASNAQEQFGLSKLAATSAASSFGALAKGIGLGDQAAAEMSMSLSGLSADLGSYFNQANDVSAKALEGIFTGEAEALKKFGVVMTQTNLEAFASSIGKVYSEMSEAEKVTLRYQFVLSKTADAQGDYARTSDGTANSIKTFQAALEDLGVAFGEELLPIITPFIQGLTKLVRSFSNLPEPVRKVIVVVGLLVAAIGPVLTAIGSIMSGIGGLMVALPGLAGALGVGGLATAAGAGASGLVGLVGSLGGFGLAAAAAVAAGAALGYCIANLADKYFPKIKEAASKAAEGVKAGMSKAADYVRSSKLGQDISHIASSMKTAFDNAGGGIKGALSAAFAGIKTAANDRVAEIQTRYGDAFNRISQTVNTATNNMRSSLTNGFNAVRTTIASTATNIRSSISTAFTSAQQSVSTSFESIKTTASTAFTSVQQSVSGSFDSIKTSASNTAKSITDGWNTLKTTANNVFAGASDSIKAKVSTAFSDISTAAGNAKKSISDGWNDLKSSANAVFAAGYDSVKTKISTAFSDITTSASNTAKNITNGWNTLKTTASNVFAGSYDSIKAKVSTAFSDISTTAENTKKSITDGWNTLKTTANNVFATGYDSIKTKISTAFSDISTAAGNTKKSIADGWDALKTKATDVFTSSYDSIKTKITSVFDAINTNAAASKTNFANMFTNMKSDADSSLKSITDYVSSAYNKAKSTLSTALKMSFTSDFKTPSILVSGKFDVDKYGYITTKPTLSLKWNKSAMQFGAILDGATIFGMMGNTLLGGGEAGKEAIIGVNSLYDLVHNASANSNNMLAQRVDALTMLLSEYLPEIAEQKNVVLDNGALVGQLVPAMNRGLGLALS